MIKVRCFFIMIIFGLLSCTRSIETLELKNHIIESSSSEYCEVYCEICGKNLFYDLKTKEEIISKIESDYEAFLEKNFIFFCKYKDLFMTFHGVCISIDIEIDDYLAFPESFYETAIWSKIFKKSILNDKDFKKTVLINLSKSRIKEIIKVLRYSKFSDEEIKLNRLKCEVSKYKELENLSKLIDIYKEENNELCFISRVVTTEYIEDIYSFFNYESISKLSPVQILEILYPQPLIENEQNDQAAIQLQFYIQDFIEHMKNSSIKVSEPQILEFFEEIDQETDLELFELIFSKLIPDKILHIKNVIKIFKKLLNLRNFDICDKQFFIGQLLTFSKASKLETAYEMIKILTEEDLRVQKSGLIDYLLECAYPKEFLDEDLPIEFIDKFKNNPCMYKRYSFYSFILNQIQNFHFSRFAVKKLFNSICESKLLKLNLAKFLIENPYINLYLYCYLLSNIIAENDEIYSEIKPKQYFSKLSNIEFTHIVGEMLYFDTPHVLAEYIRLCSKNKSKYIKSLKDVLAILRVIKKYQNLAYTVYYLIDNSFTNFKATDFNQDKFYDMFFDFLNRKAEMDLKGCLTSIYFLPFFTYFPENVAYLGYKYDIPAKELLDKVGFRDKLDSYFYHFVILKLIEAHVFKKYPEPLGEYIKEVLFSKRTSIIRFYHKTKLELDAETADKIFKFFEILFV